MKQQLGLKLWSTDVDSYLRKAEQLYDEGVYNYIELYAVPGTLETLKKWSTLKIPYIIHCPHFAHHFNLAQPEREGANRVMFEEVRYFADKLGAPVIIVHGGMGGCAEETARQLANFKEPRAFIENKPHHVILPGGQMLICRGSTPEEIACIRAATNCGFCLDFEHAVCSANSHGLPWKRYVQDFLRMEPDMFHLSGIQNESEEIDSHAHIAANEDIVRDILHLVPDGARISIETVKDSPSDLEDFRSDIAKLRRLLPNTLGA